MVHGGWHGSENTAARSAHSSHQLTMRISLLQYWRVSFGSIGHTHPPSKAEASPHMQRPDEKKRQLIADTAARLFATRPFHKVKLDDVAAAAGVGKGTLYVYFKSKEDLYFWLIYDAFARVVQQLENRLQLDEMPASQSLRLIVAELVKFGFDNPQLFELMRGSSPIIKDDRWGPRRKN